MQYRMVAFFTDVSGHHIGPIFKGQEVHSLNLPLFESWRCDRYYVPKRR